MSSPLKLLSLALLALAAFASAGSYGFSQLGQDIDGEAPGDRSGFSVALSTDGRTLATGARFNDGNGDASGHVRMYEFTGTTWTQLGADIDGEAVNNEAGFSVAVSSDGRTVAIGAPGELNEGQVRVYEFSDGTWTQLGTDIDGEAAGDFSGFSVALSSDGSTVAIGAVDNDGDGPVGSNRGHVRVYQYNGSSWAQLGSDIDGEVDFARSGTSVALSSDGRTVAIGTPNRRKVRVYEYTGTSWAQLGSDIDSEADFAFGESVALSNDGRTLAIGAPQVSTVSVYGFGGGSWSQLGNEITGEAGAGRSVDLSSDGRTVAIGAPGSDGNGDDSGQVRLYQFGNGSWTQRGGDIDGEAAGDRSGGAVALSGDGRTVAIGARDNDGNGDRSGHVRVFAVAESDNDGSLIAANSVTEPVGLDTSIDSVGEAIDVFDFALIDGGGGDNLNLNVSEIVVSIAGTADPAKISWRLGLPDGSHIPGTYNPQAGTITFTGLDISVPDGASEVYTVNIYYGDNTGLTEGQTFILTVNGESDLSVDTNGTQLGSTSAVSNGLGTTVDVEATQLVFTTQPAGSVSGAPLTTQPVVTAQDNFGNTDLDFAETVTLTEASAGTLVGGSANASSGVAAFTGVTYTATTDQETFTLTANDQDGLGSDLPQVDSNVITASVDVLDSDGDGTPDSADAFPNDPGESQDSDGDGEGDNADAFPDDPVESTDSDGDGIGDNGDAGGTGIGIALANVEAGCAFNGPVTATDTPTEGAPGTPIPLQLAFQVDGCGDTIEVTALFGDDLPAGAAGYKVGGAGDWTPIPGATVSGNAISYTVTDGGPLDADGTVNGSISDPVTAVVTSSETEAIPVAPRWLLAAVAAMLCLLALYAVRQRARA